MQNKIKIITFIGFMIIIFSAGAFGQNSKVDWYSFNMGFSNSTGSNTVVKSVVGQSFIGIISQGNNFVETGFIAGAISLANIVGVKNADDLPTQYALYQNYPNPFNPSTTIQYDIPKETFVTLKVFNMLGQEVATLVNEEKQAGSYKVKFDGLTLSNGVYFYRLKTNDFVSIKKLILIK